MTSRSSRRPPSVPAATGLLASLLALAAPAAATTPFDAPQRYLVRGTGWTTIHGPRCCDGFRFPGTFQAAYEVDAAGTVTVTRLESAVEDMNLVHYGLFGVETGRLELRCTSLGSEAPFAGAVDALGRLAVPTGAASVHAFSFKRRAADGTCDEPLLELSAASSGPVTGLLDPAGNRFTLAGSFGASYDGGTYTIELALDGTYANRPPEAQLGLVVPGFEQGGCPAVWDWGNPPEPVVEANTPGGFKAVLRSFSLDPDAALARTDLETEQWYHSEDGGAPAYLGAGADLGSHFFAMGREHAVDLLASDHLGTTDVDECRFRVVDRTPPAVAAPSPAVVPCTVPGGATPETSAELAAFLARAGAEDAGDGSPAALPARAWGADVAPGTLFPLDLVSGATWVEFRYRDASGNVGSAWSSVAVRDAVAPALSLWVTPKELAPDPGKLVTIDAGLLADDCSPVGFTLVSIKSNASAYDASDILDAATGTDDRTFRLRARPAAPGVDRIYKITYRATDLYGNSRTATAQVTVRAGGI